MKNPLVSIIIATKNEEENIENCLKSIKNQTYKNTEIIVVDNNSTDTTKEIAKKYTKFVYNRGPERSSQRNFGAEKAKGEFLFFLDADMILDEAVIGECVALSQRQQIAGVIIPEKAIGEGFWAKCKTLEKSFYHGVDWIEAARFFKRSFFEKVGGYNTQLVSGEDWDLSDRIKRIGVIARIKAFILHNEGKLALWDTLKKKYYYARHYRQYEDKGERRLTKSGFALQRYLLFLKQPLKLFDDPLVGFGLLFMKLCEFCGGGAGYLLSIIRK